MDLDRNPVHQFKNQWYFYDETWSYRYGPFETKEEAEKQLEKYAETLG